MKLSNQSLRPLYLQAMDDIKADIEGGRYAPNHKIPSEAELSGKYAVSRITIRRAVEELVSEGYLTKMQGKGTFVNPPKLARKILQSSEVQSFTETCRAAGRVAGSKLVSCEVVDARPAEREFLDLDEGAKLVYVQRIRTADGVPIMLENNFFPFEGFEFLVTANLDDCSIFSLVGERTGRIPQDTRRCTLSIVRANAEVATLLEVAVGEPLFCEQVEFLDGEGRPLLMGRQYIVGDMYLFDI